MYYYYTSTYLGLKTRDGSGRISIFCQIVNDSVADSRTLVQEESPVSLVRAGSRPNSKYVSEVSFDSFEMKTNQRQILFWMEFSELSLSATQPFHYYITEDMRQKSNRRVIRS